MAKSKISRNEYEKAFKMVNSSIHLFSVSADPLVIITRVFGSCNLPQIPGLDGVVSLQCTIFSTPYSLKISREINRVRWLSLIGF